MKWAIREAKSYKSQVSALANEGHQQARNWLTVEMPQGSPSVGHVIIGNELNYRKRTEKLMRLLFVGQVGMQPAFALRQGKAT